MIKYDSREVKTSETQRREETQIEAESENRRYGKHVWKGSPSRISNKSKNSPRIFLEIGAEAPHFQQHFYKILGILANSAWGSLPYKLSVKVNAFPLHVYHPMAPLKPFRFMRSSWVLFGPWAFFGLSPLEPCLSQELTFLHLH